MRRFFFARWLVLAALVAGCGGSSSPSGPTGSVVLLKITGLGGALKPGDQVQLTAVATRSDGSTDTPPSSAVSWISSAPAVMTVSGSGVLTAVSSGDALITATYQSVSTTTSVTVGSGGRELLGLVTESAPTENTPVVGAQVAVVTSAGVAGAAATTDAHGRFQLGGVNGTVTLQITKDGFDTGTATVASGESTATIRLVPALSTVKEESIFTCPGPGPCAESSLRSQGHLAFNLHHSGHADVTTDAVIPRSDAAPYCIELRQTAGNRLLFSQWQPWQQNFRGTFDLDGGFSYELRIYQCVAGAEFGFNYYKLTVSHPS